MSLSRALQYSFIAIVTLTVGFSLYQFNQSRASTKLNTSQNGSLTNGLVRYWPFNGGDIVGTTAYDRSGNGSTATVSGSPSAVVGKVGQAMNLNGTTQWTADNSSTGYPINGVFSESFWAKTSGTITMCSESTTGVCGALGQQGYVLTPGIQPGATVGAGVSLGTNGIQIAEFRSGYMPVLAAYTASLGTDWNHYVIVYNSQTPSIYVNGVLVRTGLTSTQGLIAPSAGIGYDVHGIFSGAVDEVRIYNRALSAGEIQSLYDLGASDNVNSSVSQPQGTGRLDSGLAGYWKLDDASGTTATDSSVNANNGTLTNGPTWGTGKIGGDVVFDGVNDYIDLGNRSILNLTNNFSVSVWANINNLTQSDYKRIYGRPDIDANNRPFYMEYDIVAHKYQGIWKNGGTYAAVAGKTLTSAGVWQHFVVTFKDGVAKSYSDGVLVSSASGLVSIPSSSSNTYIGNTDTYGLGYFPGPIDEVRVYNRALSADEVSQLYRLTTPTGVDTSLRGYWSFDGNATNWTSSSAGTVSDLSGAGNTGTLANMNRATSSASGKIGQALNFDGSTNAASAAIDLSGTAVISVSFWMKWNVWANDNKIAFEYTANQNLTNGGFIIDPNDSSGLFAFGSAGSGSYWNDGFSRPSAGAWHHYVLIIDRTTALNTAYVDGASQSLTVIAHSGHGGNFANSTLYFMSRATTSYFGAGTLDDVRIYNRALSAGEVQSLYDLGASDKVNSSVATPQGVGRLDSGLAGYWKLDENSGSTAGDSSVNANNGTFMNGPTWGTGKIGGDVVFDGVNDYIDLGNRSILNLTNNFSVSLWVNINNLTQSDWKRFFGRSHIDDANRPVYIEYNYISHCYQSVWRNGGTFAFGFGKTLTAAQWQHFVVTFKDGELKSYSDGVLASSSSGNVSPPSSSSNSYIGDNGGGYNFPGSLDEVRIYNRALSADEVSQLYRLTAPTGVDTNLTGYWSFDGNATNWTSSSAGTVSDLSGAGNTGTLTNMSRATNSVSGKLGQALNFDGVDDYVSTAFDPSPSSFTISTWVKSRNTPNGGDRRTFLSKRGTGDEWMLYQNSSTDQKIVFTAWDSGGSGTKVIAGATALVANQWYYVTLTYDGTTATLYVNGAIDGSSSTGAAINNTANPVLIGKEYVARPWAGSIDEVRIYNRALSATEVTSLYNTGR